MESRNGPFIDGDLYARYIRTESTSALASVSRPFIVNWISQYFAYDYLFSCEKKSWNCDNLCTLITFKDANHMPANIC